MSSAEDARGARLPERLDDAALDGLVAAQQAIVRRFNQLYDPYQGEGHLLHHIAEAPDGTAPTQLARLSGLSLGRVSNLLNQLERKGLIERGAAAGDRRRVTVRATDAGRARARELRAQMLELARADAEALGPRDIEALRRIARKLEGDAAHRERG